MLHLWDWVTALLPVYAGSITPVTPSMLAADIAARFGIAPTGFEIGLCLRLFTLWRQSGEQEKDF